MSINLILFLFLATIAFLIFQALTLRLSDRLGRLGVDEDKQALRLALQLAVLRFTRWLSLVAAITTALTLATILVVHLAGSPDLAVQGFNKLGEWRRKLGSFGQIYGYILLCTLVLLLAIDLFYERRRILAKAMSFAEAKRRTRQTREAEIEKLSASYLQPDWEYLPSSPEMEEINSELAKLQAEIRKLEAESPQPAREIHDLEERRRALLEAYKRADIERRIVEPPRPPEPDQPSSSPSRAERFWGFFLSKGFVEGLGGLSRLMALANVILLVPAVVGILDTEGALSAPFWRTRMELTASRLAGEMKALGPQSELSESEQAKVAEIAHSVAEILWLQDLQSSPMPQQEDRENAGRLLSYAGRAAAVRSYLNAGYRSGDFRKSPGRGPGPEGTEEAGAVSGSPEPKPPRSPQGGLLKFIIEERARRDPSFRAGLDPWSVTLKSRLRELRRRATPAELFEASLLQGVQILMGGEGASLLELLWGSRDFQSAKERFLVHLYRFGLEREELLAEKLAQGEDLGTALRQAETSPATSDIRAELRKAGDQRSSLLVQAPEHRGRTGRALPDPVEPVLAEVVPEIRLAGKTLDGELKRYLMNTIATYSDIFPGAPPARRSEYRKWLISEDLGPGVTALEKRSEIARSFDQLQGYTHLGGILIGAPPQAGERKLDVTDLLWSEDGDGVRLVLIPRAGQPLLSDPFDKDLVRRALLYAADGRLATVSIFNSAGLAAKRVLLHPALVDSGIGHDAIRMDLIIFKYTDEQTAPLQFGFCEETKANGSTLSEVREKSFAATLDALQMASRPEVEETFEFLVKKVKPAPGSEIDPEPCFSTGDVTALVRQGLREHPEDLATVERMARFVMLQRLFRMAFDGKLGTAFPVEKLLLLSQDLGAAVPTRPTPGWLPEESSYLDSPLVSYEASRVLAETRDKMLQTALAN